MISQTSIFGWVRVGGLVVDAAAVVRGEVFSQDLPGFYLCLLTLRPLGLLCLKANFAKARKPLLIITNDFI